MQAVLSFLGGLSFFLYGMRVMGEELRKMAAGRLSALLARMSSTPLRGVLFGALVTAALQSSSATTVMVVGFVNSGMIALENAVGVIMGANLGTTLTAWLLSLAGLSGQTPLLALLKPSGLSPILCLWGVLLLFTAKEREQRMRLGRVLFGFGLLFAGMGAMSGAVAPLGEDPRFAGLWRLLEDPLTGLFLGAVLTAVMQSSSASVGVLQAMCATGVLRVGSVVPIVMGQNIGTCATALLSGLGGTRSAKRAALLHLYFNVIGAALFLGAFYLLRGGGVIDTALIARERSVAMIHTLFNLFATLILLPFRKWILHLTDLTVKKEKKVELH